EYCTTLKTYGPKPRAFKLSENGEEFMLGSEVGNYLRLFRGDLYKKYPSLWRRKMTPDERKFAGEQIEYGCNSISSNVQIVKASEIEDILSGNDEKFKASVGFDTYSSVERAPTMSQSTPVGRSTSNATNANNKKSTWITQIPNSSFHLDAVPCASPVARFKTNTKRVRTFPTIYDDKNITVLHKAAHVNDVLVPIRLDIDFDGQKLRDTFTWNKHESIVTPEQFAELLCDDLDLPTGTFGPAIAASIKQQVEQFSSDMIPDDEEDRRVIIKLNIHVGNVSLVDQFEWDLSNPLNSPEDFSRQLCADLGLGGEFVTAIAYSIRGQLSWHARTYAFSEAPLPPIKFPVRQLADADQWGPSIQVLTDQEMEKKMRDQDRNTRRMRRLAQAAPGW
ncbi:hypothetical protein EMCRGX_G024650, partial [Ephydatia muelleri]